MSPYVMHVLIEFLLNDKMSFHKCVPHVDVHLVELSICFMRINVEHA